jgi:hypothetical protein
MTIDLEAQSRIDAAADRAVLVPALPDVVGLSYQEIRSMLQAKHDTSVGIDDPILMLVSIFNVYLGEFEKLHHRHNHALSEIIAAKTAEYISGVKQTTDSLTKTLADASVEGIQKIFEAQAGRLKAFESKLFWCAGLISVSAFINAVLFIWK